jgi:hypothetical protein
MLEFVENCGRLWKKIEKANYLKIRFVESVESVERFFPAKFSKIARNHTFMHKNSATVQEFAAVAPKSSAVSASDAFVAGVVFVIFGEVNIEILLQFFIIKH